MKMFYNLDILTENQEESINKYEDNMMQNVFKNVISILAYVKRLDTEPCKGGGAIRASAPGRQK